MNVVTTMGKQPLSREVVSTIMSAADLNADGKIDIKEFTAFLCGDEEMPPAEELIDAFKEDE